MGIDMVKDILRVMVQRHGYSYVKTLLFEISDETGVTTSKIDQCLASLYSESARRPSNLKIARIKMVRCIVPSFDLKEAKAWVELNYPD